MNLPKTLYTLNNVKIKMELIKLNLKLMKDIKLSEETVILALLRV